MDFWFMADNMKNKGLYVDFRNQLLKPQDLDKEQFELTIISCLKHFNLCNNILEIVKTSSPEVLEFWQKQSNKKEFKEIVSLFFSKQ